MTGTLAAPLARAMGYVGLMHWKPEDVASEILAALRSDPEVVGALAEALHEDLHPIICGGDADGELDISWYRARAAALLDALLGPKP
jgi:hypothetical protein